MSKQAPSKQPIKDTAEKLKEADTQKLKPDGSEHRPFPWVAPFPASKLVKGESDALDTESVFVRAFLSQDMTINGHKRAAGINHVLPAGLAHLHAGILSAPK